MISKEISLIVILLDLIVILLDLVVIFISLVVILKIELHLRTIFKMKTDSNV